ncbi:MAG: OmpA family protein [Shimia sp.]
MDAEPNAAPAFPRRTFLAAGLSALVAGGAVGLAWLWGLSQVAARSFRFTRGTTLATGEAEALRGFLAPALTDDRLRVTILGHTGDQGDASANQTLSEARAALAADAAAALGIPRARITAQGLGGSAPLPRRDGESDRTYQARLARVDVSLQRRR